MRDFFQVVTVVSSILMIVCILAQSRGASLGEAFGGDSAFYHTRRGAELLLFQMTIFFAVIFVVSIILSIMA